MTDNPVPRQWIDPERLQRLEAVVAAVSQPPPDEADRLTPAEVAAGSASDMAVQAESDEPEAASGSLGTEPRKPRPEIKEMYFQYQHELMTVTPHELLKIFDDRLQRGLTAEQILFDLGKTLNLMFRGLKAYEWQRPPADSFAGALMQENVALLSRLDEIRTLLKDGALEGNWAELGKRLEELEQFNGHYLKKENILFAVLERKADYFNGLAIMWALHDQIRDMFRQARDLLAAGPETARKPLTDLVGQLFFAMHGLVFKEELILLPAAMDVLSEDEWAEMAQQDSEYGFPFISPPPRQAAAGPSGEAAARFSTATGELDFGQLAAVFEALPVDLTVVDEHDRVRYFTRPKDRIFPRSPAIIGRDVRKCHPPESVDKVLEIVEAFRRGQRDTATFWIRMNGRLVLIRYFCLRDAQGAYKGTLEVSQDITDIQGLEGERRLAQWD